MLRLFEKMEKYDETGSDIFFFGYSWIIEYRIVGFGNGRRPSAKNVCR